MTSPVPLEQVPSGIPTKTALLGLLSIVPFLAFNAVAVTGAEPLISMMRPGGHTTLSEQVLLGILILALPLLGAAIALSPVVKKDAGGKRNFYILNILVAVLLVGWSLTLSTALGQEIYQCDILKVPNCD